MIFPVILAGGSGTRLWPLSRKSYPKQFSVFLGAKTLFQETALFFKKAKSINFENPIILTNEDYRFIANEQLEKIGVIPNKIFITISSKGLSLHNSFHIWCPSIFR